MPSLQLREAASAERLDGDADNDEEGEDDEEEEEEEGEDDKGEEQEAAAEPMNVNGTAELSAADEEEAARQADAKVDEFVAFTAGLPQWHHASVRLAADSWTATSALSWGEVLLAVGGGTGITAGRSGNSTLIHRSAEVARCQTTCVLFLMFVVYIAAIIVSLQSLYTKVQNDSPITFYADPRQSSACMVGEGLDEFLAAFNQAPKQVHLNVTGMRPLHDVSWYPGAGQGGTITYLQGMLHRVMFAFSLDLSSWTSRVPGPCGRCPGEARGSNRVRRYLEDGLLPEDLQTISHFLSCDTNDLATLEIQKDVDWPGWEDLASSINRRITQTGFSGVVDARLGKGEVLTVHKNKPWANFMHSRSTKALVSLSVFFAIPYLVYMWKRCQKTVVRIRVQVDIAPDEYWQLIADQLTCNGFEPSCSRH